MPLITVTVRKPKTTAFKDGLFDAVQAALAATGMPANDEFQRVLELDAEDFHFDTGYPDLSATRNDDFALIELLWAAGRSAQVKKQFLDDLMRRLGASGYEPENVMVCFKETTRENWSFAGGRVVHN